MKRIIKKARALWGKIPPRAQSAVRHFSTTFAATFALTAKPLLDGIWLAPDFGTAKALGTAAFLAAGTAAVRSVTPLAVIYGKALIGWALSKLLT